jgi:hypothetical protein
MRIGQCRILDPYQHARVRVHNHANQKIHAYLRVYLDIQTHAYGHTHRNFWYTRSHTYTHSCKLAHTHTYIISHANTIFSFSLSFSHSFSLLCLHQGTTGCSLSSGFSDKCIVLLSYFIKRSLTLKINIHVNTPTKFVVTPSLCPSTLKIIKTYFVCLPIYIHVYLDFKILFEEAAYFIFILTPHTNMHS